MSNVSPLPSPAERKERRRLHLREVAEQTADQQAAQPVDPSKLLGAVLRAARIERGEDAAQVAAALKMRRDQLEAIEANDFTKLPGRTYAVGFVRAYARHLGLDAEAMVQRYKDESVGRDFTQPVAHVFPEAPEEPRVMPNPSILVWAMLIAMVIYTVSYLTLPSRKQATTAKAEEPAVIIEQPKPAPATTAQADDDIWRSKPAEPAATFVAGDNALPKSDAPAPKEVLGDAAQTAPATFAVAQIEPVALATAAPQGATSASRVTFRAIEESYIQIKDPTIRGDRSVLASLLMKAGESYRAPDRVGLVMQTGNAGGLQVEVDGRVVGVLGKRGEVITRIPVDASYFLERIAASQ